MEDGDINKMWQAIMKATRSIGIPTPDSSAVEDIKWDPQDNTASVKFVNGNKRYTYKADRQEMLDMYNADSKGQKINYDWKFNNRMPGY